MLVITAHSIYIYIGTRHATELKDIGSGSKLDLY